VYVDKAGFLERREYGISDILLVITIEKRGEVDYSDPQVFQGIFHDHVDRI
jgi:hypothetical protein